MNTTRSVDWWARALAGFGLLIASVGLLFSGLTFYSNVFKFPELHARSSGILLNNRNLNGQPSPVLYLNCSIWNEGARTGVVDDMVLQVFSPDGQHRRYGVKGILTSGVMAPGPLAESDVFRPLAIAGKGAQAYTFFFPTDPEDRVVAGKYTMILNARQSGSHDYATFEKRQFTVAPSSAALFASGSSYYIEFDDTWDARQSLPSD